VCVTGQTQFGVWLTTLQSAWIPQDPGHGSRHFWLIHAKWEAHSVLEIHSGRQCGGELIYPGRQVHDGSPDPPA
jgi:hypothetical protein